MISPSDAEAGIHGSVAETLSKQRWREGSILPLEFEAIDHPLRRRTDWMLSSNDDIDAQNARLREEIVSLETRFHLQSQHLAMQIAEARVEARLEARQEWELELEGCVMQERERVARTCADFTKKRTSYFAAIEGEVVRLALAIAARVLHREAKLDPLLLSAVVRLALEKVADDSGAVLHVPEKQVEAWRALLAAESESTAQVIGDEKMASDGCVLETSVGRVELGVVVQLEEIEKGFFDLLQQRPA
ncbi:FliH/SctL family protein [Granulicella arctica]|uniref:Flagellar assembly protein FliH n=1 Tax=Granulicella arctica TaxID=940613 RepID=A0A7Y9PI91_9BACT|nr:FliH/SctL family protein [Granulicella arctica]NYF80341.1 flagellar assembly protein FliH [Granulicella arctica]